MSTERIGYLLRNYAANTATGEEVEELFAWLREHSEDEELQTELEKMATTTAPDQQYSPSYWEPFIRSVLKTPDHPVHRIPVMQRGWFRFAAAAVVLGIIVTAAIVVFNRPSRLPNAPGSIAQVHDIAPGRERATLTLANGDVVMLDSAKGSIVQEGDFTMVNLDGKLNYEGKDKNVQFHTLATPRGGQYKLKLPDGTEAWLNAASSITYPTAFTGTDRRVTITGEVYFEVAKDKSKPFRVNVDNKSEVEVLGTHFNINSYGDDGTIKTTLLEGSVKVSKTANGSAGGSVTLTPGQQSNIAAGTGSILVKSGVNLEQVMAWKNGLFNFDKADLKTVMAQIGRWYDIDIRYEGAVSARTFAGKVTRDLNLSQVLSILEDIEVKFRIEGRTLIVMN